MPMYNLIENSDNSSKTSGILWQYYRDEPNPNITESESFSCENNLNLTWSKKCVISSEVEKTEFAITGTKHYVPIVTISTEDNNY